VLVINADNAMADTAKLALSGKGWDGSSKGAYAGTCTVLQMTELDPTDLDEDCRTAFSDFALLAATWLADYSLTEPAPK